uniref:Conserved oligomeric Golgi complex subunit 6 n=1 Tax=Macrostomum lignano TaxID=282301 RepID=A0A1I8FZ70_9PLAT
SSLNPFAALAAEQQQLQPQQSRHDVSDAQHRSACRLCSSLHAQLADEHRRGLLWNYVVEYCFGVTFDSERVSAVPLPPTVAQPKHLASLAEVYPDRRLIGPDSFGAALADQLLTASDVVLYSFRCYGNLTELADSPVVLPPELKSAADRRLSEIVSACRSQLTGQLREYLAQPDVLTECQPEAAVRQLLDVALRLGGDRRELPPLVSDFLSTSLPSGDADENGPVVKQFVAKICDEVMRDERHFESLHCPLLTEQRLMQLLRLLASLPTCARALLAAGLPQLGGLQQPDSLFPSASQMTQQAYDAAERS